MVGGKQSCEGRVEIYYQGTWGTVCDDGWDKENADVVCRQLGCGAAVSAQDKAYFGKGSGQILLDDIDCEGNETNLGQCYHPEWLDNNCDHDEDAGVICTGNIPFPIALLAITCLQILLHGNI